MIKTNFKNINEVFLHHCDIELDRNFIMRVMTYVAGFVRKDENSINFWGSNLIGVYPVKWISDDKQTWIEDILHIGDYDQLVIDINNLPHINSSFVVSSDAINLSFIWVAQHALLSTTLAEKDKEQLATAAINMLQYKFISSIHTHCFKYSANLSVALAVYESLSNKSQLKRLGSWGALISARTKDILDTNSLHTRTIRDLDNDDNIVDMVNDIWNRIKSIFNILNREFYRIKDTDARIASADKFSNVDGEAILKDSINKYSHIKERMHSIIPDKNTFIYDDLLKVINITINTTYPVYLKNTLLYISSNYVHDAGGHKLPLLLDDILMFIFKILRKDKIELNNLPAIGIKLKGILRASRITAPEYISIKERIGVLVQLANPNIAESNIASTRISTIMYIVLRGLLPK